MPPSETLLHGSYESASFICSEDPACPTPRPDRPGADARAHSQLIVFRPFLSGRACPCGV